MFSLHAKEPLGDINTLLGGVSFCSPTALSSRVKYVRNDIQRFISAKPNMRTSWEIGEQPKLHF